MAISGTAGDDDIDGTPNGDEFDMSQGGDDVVHALVGNDSIGYGATFDAHDRVFGGAGVDTIVFEGAYDFTFRAQSIKGVEAINLADGFDYTLRMDDANAVGGRRLAVDGHLLTGEHFLSLDATAETDSPITVFGGAANDLIKMGAGDDEVFGNGGDDFINAGQGADFIDGGLGADVVIFQGKGAFDNHDRVDGGLPDASFRNTVALDGGGYEDGLLIKRDTLTNVHVISVVGDHDYALDVHKMNFDSVGLLSIDGQLLSAGHTLQVDATGAPEDAGFFFAGGPGDDVFLGGRGDEEFTGFGGQDLMFAGQGSDVFYYHEVSESAGKACDIVDKFDAREDFFFCFFTNPVGGIGGVDPKVHHGTVSSEHFNDDIEAAVGAGELGINHAVLFQAKHGDATDTLFVIVDANGVAGYQGNKDLLVALVDATHMDEFDTTNFGNFG